MTGRTIRHYEVLEKLGAGAMGVVYKGRHRVLGRTVALKFMAPHLMESEAARTRFLKEARTVSALMHPNIAVLYEAEEVDGQWYLALEYLAGGTLKARLAELRRADERMPLGEALECMKGLAAGLACAHRSRILHRDVKPENLMFAESGGALKITDFGLSKFLEGGDTTLTEGIAGTRQYMSPEQTRGLKLDERSDIFSAGVVMYEVLTGGAPFRGATTEELFGKIQNAKPAPVGQLRPEVPAALERIVEKALEKSPAARYQRTEELGEDLRAFEGTMGGSTEESRRRRGRGRLWLAGAAFAVAAALGTMAIPGVRERVARVFAGETEMKQLAVLPFRNIAGDPAFCDGLTETVTAELASLEQFHDSLAVTPSSDVRQQSVKSAEEARRLFGSNLVLTGSVERMGDDARLIVTLSSTKPLKSIDTRTLTKKWENLADLQDEVVENVLGMLDVQMADTKGLIGAGKTANSEAYRLYTEAEGYAQRSDQPGNVDLAADLLQRAVERDPNYAQALAALGEARKMQFDETRDRKRLEEATDEADRALRLNQRLPRARVVLGRVAEAYGEYARAEEEFNRALALDPLDSRAMSGLAGLYQKTGRAEEAEKLYRKAIARRPGDWWVFNDLGGLLFDRGRYREAIPWYRKVLELTPGNPVAYVNLGSMYTLLGDYGRAERVYRDSIAASPTAEAWSDLGTALFDQGKYREAAQANEKAVELKQSEYKIYGNLADCYRWIPGERERAAPYYETAIRKVGEVIEVNPKDGEALSARAIYEGKLGRMEAALRDAARAEAVEGDNWQVLYNVALAYRLAGRTEKGLATLEAAVKAGYSVTDLKNDPEWAGMGKDGRFQKILAGK